MIEFLLLFSLGFLTAVMLGVLVAPIVYKRIIRFAEDRLKATMPLSPQEVRAQKDAARAGYAAENARTEQMLKRERDKTVALMLEKEAVIRDMQRLSGENADLHAQIETINVEAGNFRSQVRRLEQSIDRLTNSLAVTEKDDDAKKAEIYALSRQINTLSMEIDNLKIDLAARNAEAENLKSRMTGLRDERDIAREEARTEGARAREFELRLSRDETKLRQIEQKLSREIAANADKDSFLDRRASEIDRLKQKLKDNNNELRDALKAARAAGTNGAPRKERKPAPAVEITATAAATDVAPNLSFEHERNRVSALSERLATVQSTAHDAALREEIADIAASVVALTAAREGAASPIHAILDKAPADAEGDRVSLAARASALMPPKA
ncbi:MULTISPECIES: hypothetical protein [unclassified Rhizobium]|uniref:hypothetical protein n=1 Tax=unclassified Rhizobium TaxID=2613769 RepID=UPI0006F96B57|nr:MULTISPECIES: hypothetical protein [unclassified Rhizobium]KQV35153.1 hypothetical protein ASC86_13155 [Rhizobium sp. Root1212]KRD24958.1 hypothetical protein ASE37_13150 [Rhizobium sp. Root268]